MIPMPSLSIGPRKWLTLLGEANEQMRSGEPAVRDRQLARDSFTGEL